MKKLMLIVLFCAVFIGYIFEAKTEVVSVPSIIQSSTPTIDFYQEDLYAQCRGLESLNELLEEHPSLRMNGNFRKEVQLRLETIERDKEMLGLDFFECP